MAYTSGVVEAADSIQFGIDLQAVIDQALVNAGYVKSQHADATYPANLYRFPGEGAASPWLAVSRYAPAGYIYVSIFGAYNETTKIFSKRLSLASTSSESIDANGFVAGNSSGPSERGWTLTATTSAEYWLSVTPERLILATRYGNTDSAVYAGKYEQAPGRTVGMPYVCSTNGLTRFTLSSTSGMEKFGVLEDLVKTAGSRRIGCGVHAVGPTVPNATMDVYTNKFLTGRLALVSWNMWRGYLLDCIAPHFDYPNGSRNGDLMTVGGKTYVRMGHGTSLPAWVDTTV